MRLARLDLTRYGHFTDRVLDFPTPEAGAPDLHVLYGGNEAGKSTAQAAFLDLLYGIPERSTYDFLHPYPTMRIGAALEIDGRAQEVRRVKRRTGSLTDADGQPLPQALLDAALGGLDRDEARMMFSLDDETLEKGGESILASKGDLGQLLFSASAGLAALSDRLAAVQAEADGFRRPSGRGDSALARGKARLEELTAARRARDLQAAEHAELIRARDAAETAHAEAEAALALAVGAHEALRRRAAALPWRDQRARLGGELAALADLPEAPAAWAEEVEALTAEQAALREMDRASAAAVAAALAERDGATPEPAALALAPRLAAAEGLHAAALAADKDLPNRRADRARAAARVATLLSRLGRPDAAPASLLLPAAAVERLRGLIEAQGLRAAAQEAAAAELRAAEARLAELRTVAGSQAGEAEDPSADAALARTLARLRAAEPAGRLRAARRDLAAAEARLVAALAALAPWRGDAAALEALALPPEDRRAAWRRDLPAAARAADAAAAEAARAEAEAARLAAMRAAAVGAQGPAEVDLSALRAARERAWATHRARLDAASADAFEAAMRAHDLGAEDRATARAAQAAAAARDADRAEALAAAQTAARQAGAVRVAAEARFATLAGDLAAGLVGLGLPRDWSAEALDAWLAGREAALSALAAQRAAEAEATAAADAAAEALAALGAAGLPVAAGLEAALDAAQDRLDRAAERRALAEAAALRDGRARVATAASAALERWQADWATACADNWLGAEGTPAPDAVRAALDLLAELGPAQAAEADLADRIAKMERDRDGFAAELAAMAAALDLPKAPAFELWHQLRTRVEAAARAAEARAAAERRLAQAQEVRARFATRAEALEARRAPICAHFGVETLREAAERLAALSRRRQLAQERDAAGRALAAALGCATPEAAEKALAGTESDALAAEEDSAAAARASAEEALREAHAARAAARAALVAAGGDDAVARIEAERAVVLTELADGLRRHLRLRLGILAVEAGLTAWRERHRGAMLDRAAAAFAAITRGAYAGLDTQPSRGEGREELIAIPAGGGAKQVTSLSKGTRFQLYLALRVAGHAEYARHRPPMPFLADDIMETFDDARAEAAFAALAQMGRAGQVIYLTHHRHLCEIARAAVPGVRVQSLEG